MNITVLLPKFKEDVFYKNALKEYEKRLSSYCKFKFSNSFNVKNNTKKLYIIEISMTSAFKDNTFVTSEEFAKHLLDLGTKGHSDIIFTIDFDIKTESTKVSPNEIISLSSLDLSNTSTSLVLIEQIYRAYRIINNEPYHK